MNMKQFLNRHSATSHHMAKGIVDQLEGAGFQSLSEADPWSLKPGGKYFVERNGAVAAWISPTANVAEQGFRLSFGHTDHPALKVKQLNEQLESDRLRIEVYGGPIFSTWTDRELKAAFILWIKDASGSLTKRLILSDKPLCFIPNPPIHLKRDINKGIELNPHTHLRPLVIAEEGTIGGYLTEQHDIQPDTIVYGEMHLVSAEDALISGDEGYIRGQGLDNALSCFSMVKGITSASPRPWCNLALWYDHEEIGSRTREGGQGRWLMTLLDRINGSLGGTTEDLYRALAHSIQLSLDAAHGANPNYKDLFDDQGSCILGNGIVLKQHQSYKYGMAGAATAQLLLAAQSKQIPIQYLSQRADVPTGSTLGMLAEAVSDIPTVDMGVPLWSMHSLRETCHTRDVDAMTELIKALYMELLAQH